MKFGRIEELAYKGKYAFINYYDPRDAKRAYDEHPKVRG